MPRNDELAARRARTKYSMTQTPADTLAVDVMTRAREEYALAYCWKHRHRIRGGQVDEHGHTIKGDPQGCQPDLQDSLMGRLGRRTELPPLGSGAGPIHKLLDGILADFGEHSLDGLWEDVNTERLREGKPAMAQTAVAIRTRELREHGRTLNHRSAEGGHGSDVYWYARPEAG